MFYFEITATKNMSAQRARDTIKLVNEHNIARASNTRACAWRAGHNFFCAIATLAKNNKSSQKRKTGLVLKNVQFHIEKLDFQKRMYLEGSHR